MKKQLPNILTLINLSLGILSIIWASQNKEYLVVKLKEPKNPPCLLLNFLSLSTIFLQKN